MKRRKYRVRDLENLSQYDIRKLNRIKLKLEKDNIEEIGEDVRFLRKEILGEIQEEFAEYFRVGQTTITQWENEERNPSGPALVILEQILDQILKQIIEQKIRKEISLNKYTLNTL